MSWVAVAIGGSALVGGVMAKQGQKAQGQGVDRALSLQQQQFETVRADTAAQREIGTNAINKLADILGIERSAPAMPTREQFTSTEGRGGDRMAELQKKIDPLGPFGAGGKILGFGKKKGGQPQTYFDQAGYDAAMTKWQQETETFKNRPRGMAAFEFDPGYQFRLANTERTIDRYQSAGRITGGRAIKEAQRYGQDFASGEFERGTDRLFRLAGYGTSGVNTATQAGLATAGNMANLNVAAGQNMANYYANLNNAMQGAAQNYMTYRAYQDWMKPTTPIR